MLSRRARIRRTLAREYAREQRLEDSPPPRQEQWLPAPGLAWAIVVAWGLAFWAMLRVA